MADNVSITPGSGNTVGADEVTDATLGTVKVQYVKIMDGTLDGTTKAAVSSTGLRVDLTGSTLTATSNALDVNVKSTTGNQPTNTVQLNGATISLNTGVRDAGTQRVTIATNDVVPVSESGTWTVQPGNTANTTPWLVERRATTIQTYTASAIALLSAAAATDIFTVTGSATKTVKVKQLTITSTATAAGNTLVVLLKRSTADTAGTSTAPTRVPHDSANAAATATVLAYTANPTAGTLVGNVRVFRHAQEIATTGTVDRYYEEFGQENQPIVLRGIAEVFAVNLNGVTIAGGSFNISVVWTEE